MEEEEENKEGDGVFGYVEVGISRADAFCRIGTGGYGK